MANTCHRKRFLRGSIILLPCVCVVFRVQQRAVRTHGVHDIGGFHMVTTLTSYCPHFNIILGNDLSTCQEPILSLEIAEEAKDILL